MKRKLIATFLLLIVLPTALLSIYVVTQSQHMAVDNAQRSTLRTMEQTAREVENLAHRVEYASDVLYQDPVLRAFLERELAQGEELQKHLSASGTEGARKRAESLAKELEETKEAYHALQ